MIPIEMMVSGQLAEIVDVSGSPEAVCRLNEIGLSAGACIQIVRSGMPCILSLGGRRISFRGENSAAILVRAL
jgi:Fe2+ transport system protein FeoA